MLFNSVSFLIFFPIVTILYFLIPHRARWILLLIASYYFYMCWSPMYALLMLTSTFLTYLSGIAINSTKIKYGISLDEPILRTGAQLSSEYLRGTKLCKLWVALSLIANFSILFVFKYYDFFASSFNRAFTELGVSTAIPTLSLLLPVGISFYTFQALSYTMDIYRGEIRAQKHFGKYALFVSFFPQLVAGPIERSKNLLTQIDEKHSFDYDRAKSGALLMIWGLFQKIVIADRVAVVVNTVYDNYTKYNGLTLAFATAAFAVQIYCDFCGYSDVAIGAAEVMGFRLMQNFRQPYFATSIKDFWRRWHISLSTWFKDYLYIPLGGSRCSRSRNYLNLFVTFLLSGLWHGASWHFVMWGVLHAMYQIVGDILKPVRAKACSLLKINTQAFSYRLLQIITTFSLVCLAWVFFRAPSFMVAIDFIKRMFTGFSPEDLLWKNLSLLGLKSADLLVSLFATALLFIVDWLRTKMSLRKTLAKQNLYFQWAAYIFAIYTVFLVAIQNLGYPAQQFIYFQF